MRLLVFISLVLNFNHLDAYAASPKVEIVSEDDSIVADIEANQVASVLKWIRQGHSPMAKIKNKLKESLIDHAAAHDSISVFRALLSEMKRKDPHAKLVDSRGTPLLLSLTSLAGPDHPRAQDYEAMIHGLLSTYPESVKEKDRAYVGDGRTALHQAAAIGSVSLLESFIAYGGDVNAKNASGETPLHLAARFGRVEVVRYLIAKHAKIDVFTYFTKATPLMAAAETGQAPVIRLLMASGANKKLKDAFGKTAPERYKEYRLSNIPLVPPRKSANLTTP